MGHWWPTDIVHKSIIKLSVDVSHLVVFSLFIVIIFKCHHMIGWSSSLFNHYSFFIIMKSSFFKHPFLYFLNLGNKGATAISYRLSNFRLCQTLETTVPDKYFGVLKGIHQPFSGIYCTSLLICFIDTKIYLLNLYAHS